MKNFILLLISILMISCSTQKVLKTDTQQDIDLSGRWNNTDAEIATSELFNNLVSSAWLKDYQSQNNLKPRIKILEFDSNFKDGGDKLNHYFTQYTKTDASFELIEDSSEKKAEFFLTGKITAEEFITESDNYIDYTLITQLKNMDEEILWEDKNIVKKYIKD
ncbi:hypothetical protein QYS49_20475 [Marivirga salinae]|uniref:Uncharacterized protein n=1 Tax=Marivirga salinarum TaxID=3059078 RepID=A0AA49J8F5_9BACT|nr:hypothetical protein [Marivirga sp. BDSF4-3]WKK74155.1 hypothetical protein QYS49_20475 [Marivirga sp. BDSF4-3]